MSVNTELLARAETMAKQMNMTLDSFLESAIQDKLEWNEKLLEGRKK